MQVHYALQWSPAAAPCARSRLCCISGAMDGALETVFCAAEDCGKPCASSRSWFCIECRSLCRKKAGKIGGKKGTNQQKRAAGKIGGKNGTKQQKRAAGQRLKSF